MGQQNKEKLCSNSLQPISKPKSRFSVGAGQLGIPSTANAKMFLQDKGRQTKPTFCTKN